MSEAVSLRAQLEGYIGNLVIDVAIDTGPGTLVLVGPNGAGKTTVLSLLLGIRPVVRGRIEARGAILLDTANAVNVPVEARRLAYVPQNYALFPHLTVRGNVEFAVSSSRSLSRTERSELVDLRLSELGIDAFAHRYPESLSGGEKQRVALARALAVEPRALLLDEPLAALDVHSRRTVRDFLAEYLRTLALPTVVVTHDAADARRLGHRIAVLENGRITQCGTWDELRLHPASPFVEGFVAPADA